MSIRIASALIVLLLNTRRRIKGHHLASIGTLDALLVSAHVVFRVAIVAAASAIVVMHMGIPPATRLRLRRIFA
jgi:DNA repair protein RadC